MQLNARNILIIEDSPGIRTFLAVSLGHNGACIHEAATAGKGLELFHSVNPDVVILDLGLPDKDGLELLPSLRAPHIGHTPAIIVLTVRNDTQTRNHAMRNGANAFVSKPFMMDELYECIRDVF